MEDESIFDPPVDNNEQSFVEFNPNEIIDNNDSNNDDFGDFQELIKLFEQKKPKNNIKIEDSIPQFIKQNDNLEKKLNFDDEIYEKMKIFLLKVYKFICEDSEENELIDKEKIDDNVSNDKDEIDFINILKKFIENEKKNYKMKISMDEENSSFNDKFFIIYLNDKHKINMCNDLLKMKIKIKIKINMAISNGNIQIKFYSMQINYNHKNQELKLEPNLKCTIINSNIGKRGMTYCTCENCDRCKNKHIFPFDDLLFYLKEQNKIKEELKFTDLYFKGCNSYKNDSNYKCSFCQDFYAKKSNIVRLFCNEEIDPEHTCQFWICRNCYNNINKYRDKNRDIEPCPNCGKFFVNFSCLKSLTKWKMKQKK